MAPFMRVKADGRQGINAIRLVEQFISAFVIGGIVLWGGYLIITERLDVLTGVVKGHVVADEARQVEIQKWRMTQFEMTTRHETILKQEGIIK